MSSHSLGVKVTPGVWSEDPPTSSCSNECGRKEHLATVELKDRDPNFADTLAKPVTNAMRYDRSLSPNA